MNISKTSNWIIFFLVVFFISVNAQWIKQTFPSNEYLYIVKFASPEIGWILGQDHIFKTTDGGETWSINDTTSDNIWRGFYVIDDTTVIRAGYSKYGIRRTSDGGKTWVTIDSTIRDIDSFDFINSKLGFASGGFVDTANVYRTIDGGKNWERIAHTNIYQWGSDFSKVSFIDSLQGWAVSYDGMIFHTTDGGFNWKFQDSTALNNHAPLRDIQFTSPDSGWAVGGISGYSIYLRTTDGGNTWISSSVPTNFATCSFREICMINSRVGWLVGSYNGGPFLFKTTDGGINWANETPKEVSIGLESISMINETDGFVVGEGFYKTSNGGVTDIDEKKVSLVDKFHLSQNYPNPFNPTTTIQYSIPKESFVTIKVYDDLGREIATLLNERKAIGNYSVDFNSSNLSSGIYFYRLISGTYSATKKMILMK